MKKQEVELIVAKIPPVSKEFVTHLEAVFRPRPVKDDDTLIAIGRSAGRQEVIDFIKRFQAGGTAIHGNIPEDTKNTNLNFFQEMTKDKHNG